LISEENEYLDWLEFAQKAITGMTESEANQFIAEIPELSQVKEQSPFIKNHVTGIIDEVSGVEIK